MHPQVFLTTFWQMKFRPQVFVAMSFDDKYKSRFEDIIAPAIQSIAIRDKPLQPYRVDLSKTGDSILTDIMDGIAHSQLVLADVSTIGRDAVTGNPYRNANVLYEVGLALACRQSSEVLLIRDDKDKFLFDVSTVPHMTLNFTEKNKAVSVLKEELNARLKEQSFVRDARVQLASASLDVSEADILRQFLGFPEETIVELRNLNRRTIFHEMAVTSLLDKQLIKVMSQVEEGNASYIITPLGRAVVEALR